MSGLHFVTIEYGNGQKVVYRVMGGVVRKRTPDGTQPLHIELFEDGDDVKVEGNSIEIMDVLIPEEAFT